MQIIYSKNAILDLNSLETYISKDNPIAARKVANNILLAVKLLETMPKIGRPGKIKETRELIIHNLPYLVRYKINKETIQIINVFHTSRKLK